MKDRNRINMNKKWDTKYSENVDKNGELDHVTTDYQDTHGSTMDNSTWQKLYIRIVVDYGVWCR